MIEDVKKRTYSICLVDYNKQHSIREPFLKDLELYGLKQTVNNTRAHGNILAFKEHKHSYYELHIITGGKQCYVVCDEKIYLGKGEFLLIPPGVGHILSPDVFEYSKYYIMLKFPNVFPFNSSSYKNAMSEKKFLVGSITDKIIFPIDYLFSYYSQSDADCISLINSCMYLFLRAFADYITDELQICERAQVSVGTNDYSQYYDTKEFCEAVSSYISDNISQRLTLEEAAAHFCISSRQLNRKLQQCYGMSFKDVCAKVRCDYAKKMLQYTELSMLDITEAIGYGDVGSFIRLFKRVVGQTPKRFKEKYSESQKIYKNQGK